MKFAQPREAREGSNLHVVLGGLIAEHMPSGPLSAARDSADLQSECHHRGCTVTCSTEEELQQLPLQMKAIVC